MALLLSAGDMTCPARTPAGQQLIAREAASGAESADGTGRDAVANCNVISVEISIGSVSPRFRSGACEQSAIANRQAQHLPHL